ncbi:MAG: response regulator transcription factor [Gemmatimonadaceae bacterium]
MARLLVVEDDRMFAELIRRGLKEEGHAVDVAADVAEGRMLAFVHEYDGILLDLVLPDGSGLQVARALRTAGRQTPILMLTGNDEPTDVVRALDAGVDDYVTKPCDIGVLKARVRALLRRGGARRLERLALGGVVMDRANRVATANGRPLQLTPKEYSLLAHLLAHADEVVTRTDLLEKIWDLHFDPGSNVVDVHVARLRTKLRDHGAEARIVTVRGAGFKLTTETNGAG